MRDVCPRELSPFFEVMWPNCLCTAMCELCPRKMSLFLGHVTKLPMRCYARPVSCQNFLLFLASRDQIAYALFCTSYVLPKISLFLEVRWLICLCAVIHNLCSTKNFSFFWGHMTNLPMRCYEWPMLCAAMRNLCSTKNVSFFGGHVTKLPMRCYERPMSYQKFLLFLRSRDQFTYALLCMTYVMHCYAWPMFYQKCLLFWRLCDQIAYVLLCATYVLPKISAFLSVTWPNCLLLSVMRDVCRRKLSPFLRSCDQIAYALLCENYVLEKCLFFLGHVTKLPMRCYARPVSCQNFLLF